MHPAFSYVARVEHGAQRHDRRCLEFHVRPAREVWFFAQFEPDELSKLLVVLAHDRGADWVLPLSRGWRRIDGAAHLASTLRLASERTEFRWNEGWVQSIYMVPAAWERLAWRRLEGTGAA